MAFARSRRNTFLWFTALFAVLCGCDMTQSTRNAAPALAGDFPGRQKVLAGCVVERLNDGNVFPMLRDDPQDSLVSYRDPGPYGIILEARFHQTTPNATHVEVRNQWATYESLLRRVWEAVGACAGEQTPPGVGTKAP